MHRCYWILIDSGFNEFPIFMFSDGINRFATKSELFRSTKNASFGIHSRQSILKVINRFIDSYEARLIGKLLGKLLITAFKNVDLLPNTF